VEEVGVGGGSNPGEEALFWEQVGEETVQVDFEPALAVDE